MKEKMKNSSVQKASKAEKKRPKVEGAEKPAKIETDVIDSLFDDLKTSKKKKLAAEADAAEKEKKKKRKEKSEEVEDSSSNSYGIIKSDYHPVVIVNPEAPLERIDKESGLPVYKAHLLKVGEGEALPCVHLTVIVASRLTFGFSCQLCYHL